MLVCGTVRELSSFQIKVNYKECINQTNFVWVTLNNQACVFDFMHLFYALISFFKAIVNYTCSKDWTVWLFAKARSCMLGYVSMIQTKDKANEIGSYNFEEA